MTTYNFGDIVLLEFPFSGAVGSKKRPALVFCNTKDGDFIVCRVSTRPFSSKYEIPVSDWRAAGLLATSYIKLHKIATLEMGLVNKKIGTFVLG